MGGDDLVGAETLTVVHRGVHHLAEPGERLTFGRAAGSTIRIGSQGTDHYDLRLSRDAGYFEAVGQFWYVWAMGNPLDVLDDFGGVALVPRGRALSIGHPHLLVVVRGTERVELEVKYPAGALPAAVSYLPRRSDEPDTERPPDPIPTTREKVVYVAKLAPLLERTGGPRSLTSTAAFLRANGDRSYTDDAVRNLWATWVEKCVAAGFTGITRSTGLEELSADRGMFRELTLRGLLVPEDLKVLPRTRR